MTEAAIPTLRYFSDVLCFWAYVSQIRLDELRHQFGGRIKMEYHFMPLFGHVGEWIELRWQARGGLNGYARHVQQMARPFDHISLHPELWQRNVPASSAGCHEFLKAVQSLEQDGFIAADPQPQYDGRTLFEETLWRCRLAFFRDLRNIAQRSVQEEIATDMGLPLTALRERLDDGRALAALCADFSAKERFLVEGSPTFLFPGGRQKLYGNVGYRIIEANLHELLDHHDTRASWC